MRKILLATTALVGFMAAGAAQAATSPLTVNVGGSVDFLAGAFHEAGSTVASTSNRANNDFETLYGLDFNAAGRSSSGVQYGGTLSMNNMPDINNNLNGAYSGLNITTADIFMSGAFGKVQLGDSHGATDLALTTPTVGEGQVNGRYQDFLDTNTFAKNLILGVDSIDHSTNITYFTPKVGNRMNKVQAAVSFVPNFYNYGSSVVQVQNTQGVNGGNSNSLSPYRDVVKAALAYTGTFSPVTVGASAHVITGSADQAASAFNAASDTNNWMEFAPAGSIQDFTAWGLGAQAAMEGFTFGATYLDQGHYDTVVSQSKEQHQYSAGLKYEFSKYAVAASYLGGEGYGNMLSTTAAGPGTGSGYNYVKDFNSEGLGGAYTWTPGLTTNLDGVMFQQKTDVGVANDGYVLLVSQKLAF